MWLHSEEYTAHTKWSANVSNCYCSQQRWIIISTPFWYLAECYCDFKPYVLQKGALSVRLAQIRRLIHIFHNCNIIPGSEGNVWMQQKMLCSSSWHLKGVVLNCNNMYQLGAFQVAQWVKNPPTIQVTQVQSLGQEDALEESMATHSRILAWRIPWTQEPGGLWSKDSQKVRHDWRDLVCEPALNSFPHLMTSHTTP